MPDFSKWESKSQSPNTLYLDSLNPRLSEGAVKLTQRDLIRELLETNNVMKLCEDISNQGYFPTEVLVAVEEDGKTIVIEGNRRLAALKLLSNPELAPDEYVAKIKKFSKSSKSPSKIPVVVSPTRDDAIPLLMSRHTQTPVERWTPAMQAAYMKRLIDQGSTPKQISIKYGILPAKIEDILNMDYLYKLACGVDVSPEAQSVVRDPHQFSLTNLERLMNYNEVRTWLGITRTPGGKYSAGTSRPDFERAFGKIVEDVALGNIDSRKAQNEKLVKKYLSDLAEYKPSKKSGSFDPTAILKKPKPVQGKTTSSDSKPKINHKLFPRSLRCDSQSRRVSRPLNNRARTRIP